MPESQFRALETSAITAQLADLLTDGEEWLMERILYYAHRQDYTQYTSTLVCAWRLSISGLTDAIRQGLASLDDPVIDFRPDNCLDDNPLTAFAVSEALIHRGRGTPLAMFLGLLKYYRQSYLDLVADRIPDGPQYAEFNLILHRLFDLFEISLVSSWNSTSLDNIINELSAANRAITNEKNFYLTAYESLGEPSFLLDESLTITTMNSSAQSLLKGSLVHAGELYYRLKSPDKNEAADPDIPDFSDSGTLIGRQLGSVIPELAEVLSTFSVNDDPVRCETEISLGDRQHDVMFTQSPMRDVSGKFRGSVVFLKDISDRKAMEDQLRELSERDPLTGLFNRRVLEDLGAREVERARRVGNPTSAIVLDLDLFKDVNDQYGHQIGDAVLKRVADTCVALTRRYDTVARVGGEEFVVLLPQTNALSAQLKAEELRGAISECCKDLEGLDFKITASMGVAELAGSVVTLDALLNKADNAMYDAKRLGRNCVAIAAESHS